MKRIVMLSLIAVNAINLVAATTADTNPTELGSVSILGDNNVFPVTVVRDTKTMQTVINEDGIKRSMGLGGSNVFKAVELAPSVNVQSDDPYGLTGGSIRVRGFDQTAIGFSLDGVPLNDSGNFAVYPHEYSDAENLSSVALTRGSTKSSAPFYSDIGGSVELKSNYPSKKFHAQVHENFGSYGMWRGFYRVDSGELSTGTKLFASFSHTKANKWKGSGEAPDHRNHFALGVTQEFGNVHAELFYDYNDQLNYSYKYHQMDWTKAQDYKKYYTTDNSSNPTDGDYYKLNSNPYTNQVLRGALVIPVSNKVSIDIKPYLWLGEGGGYYSYGAPSKITYGKSLNYTTRPGVVAKVNAKMDEMNLEAGIWYEYSDLENFSNRYKGTDGDYILSHESESFKYWGYIYDTKTTTSTPFISLQKNNIANLLDMTVGLKYAMVDRDVKGYDTSAVTSDYSGDSVYDHVGALNPAQTYTKSYAMLLPRLRLGLNLDNGWYPFFSYARTFKVPGYRLSGDQNASDFVNNLNPEVADGFNLATRYTNNDFFVTPGLFYTHYIDKIVSKEIAPNVSVPQNVGKTSSYGFEIEAGKRIMKHIKFYGSYGYTKAIYENNYNGLNVKGNQLADTPEHTLAASVGYDRKDFSTTLTAKYISSRYGDATNTQKVDGNTRFNFYMSKGLTLMGIKFTGVLSAKNIFDTKYIGGIAAGDTKGYYYAGTPRTISLGLHAKF